MFPGANLGGRPEAPVVEVSEPTVEPAIEDMPIEAVAEPMAVEPVIAEPVDEAPIVDVEVKTSRPDAVLEPTPAKKATRRRRPATARAAKPPKAKAAKPPRARRTPRPKTPALAADKG